MILLSNDLYLMLKYITYYYISAYKTVLTLCLYS